jgi:hypothetical protein
VYLKKIQDQNVARLPPDHFPVWRKRRQDDPQPLPEMPASVYKRPLDSALYLQSGTTAPIPRTLIRVRKPQATVDVIFTHPSGRYRNVLLKLVESEILEHDADPL